MLLLADAQELHATLYDALGGVAIAVADAVAERTVVNAYANGRVMGPADVEERDKTLLYLAELLGVLLIGVLLVDKLAGRVYVVAGVDAHLLGIEGSHVGHVGVEVDVGHQGRVEPIGTYAGIDILAACADDALSLSHAPVGIIGIGSGHRLDAYGVVATHVDGPYVYHRRGPAPVVKQVNCTCTHSRVYLPVPCWPSLSWHPGQPSTRPPDGPPRRRSGLSSRPPGWRRSGQH